MKAHLITNLSGKINRGRQHDEPHGTLSTVLLEPKPGWMIQVKLGPAGLQVNHHDVTAVLPMAEIISLVQSQCPELFPSADPPAAAVVKKKSAIANRKS